MKDFYYILGIAASSGPAEITEAYQKLSKKLYPDLNDNDSYFKDRFLDIREAYETLIDPVKRKRYDIDLNRYKASKKQTSSKTRILDVVATLILIVFTALFGRYVIKSIYGSKEHQTYNAPAIVQAVKHKPLHHKRKKAKLSYVKALNKPAVFVKPPITVNTPTIVEPAATISDYIKEAPLLADAPVSTPKVKEEIIVHKAEIRSNETGVVYMREFERYNSAVIKVIPDRTKVQVLEKGDRYFKVQFDSVAGYVPKWTVQLN
jgi:hypothetical protein